MYSGIVPNRNSRLAILTREGWRDGKKVCKRTLANLTEWPARKVWLLRRVLKEEPLVSPTEALPVGRPDGDIQWRSPSYGTIYRMLTHPATPLRAR